MRTEKRSANPNGGYRRSVPRYNAPMDDRPSTAPLRSPLGATALGYADAVEQAGGSRYAALEDYRTFFRSPSELDDSWADQIPAAPTTIHESPADEGMLRKFLMPIAAPVAKHAHAERNLPSTLESESVIIPMRARAHTGTTYTLCVSSQVGCAMGCEFCETAQMGLIKNLSPQEIVAQWFAAKHHLGAQIKNIVFMGMGEPLDNPDAVLDAIACLTDQRGAALAMRHITVSTVGRLDGLEKLRARVEQSGWRRLNLAVSVNAPNDEIRSTIMPINRSMPLRDLVGVMEGWPLRTSAAICAEYVLIPGVNDANDHADQLADLLKNVRCCVNVIPYNPRRDSPWPAPQEADVDRFMARLTERGQFCKRRRTKGRDRMAACGQLGNEQIRRRRFVGVSINESAAIAP